MYKYMCYILIEPRGGTVPQLHLYVPKELAAEIARQARAHGVSVSRYLADLVRREVGGGWPGDYFEEVPGGWVGEPLERPDQGAYELREEL
jgi:hypothetical protein